MSPGFTEIYDFKDQYPELDLRRFYWGTKDYKWDSQAWINAHFIGNHGGTYFILPRRGFKVTITLIQPLHLALSKTWASLKLPIARKCIHNQLATMFSVLATHHGAEMWIDPLWQYLAFANPFTPLAFADAMPSDGGLCAPGDAKGWILTAPHTELAVVSTKAKIVLNAVVPCLVVCDSSSMVRKELEPRNNVKCEVHLRARPIARLCSQCAQHTSGVDFSRSVGDAVDLCASCLSVSTGV